MMQKIRKQSSALVPCARRSRGCARRNEKNRIGDFLLWAAPCVAGAAPGAGA
ncbi:hypothetical protein A2U01_0096231, partial [Trifolium medium]|nr:hypothetical protein [Trifolium medium]